MRSIGIGRRRKFSIDRAGFLPWPGAYSYFRGQMFHIWKARVSGEALQGEPGLMSAMDKRLLIACGERTELELIEVQVEGRKRMSGRPS